MMAGGGRGLCLVLVLAAGAAQGKSVRTTDMRYLHGPADSPMQMPSDCAVGPGGLLYVLDGVQHRIVVFDTQGRILRQFGERGSAPGQFQYPLGITVTADNTVYIADAGNHRIQILTARGQPVKSIDLPAGHEGPADPTGIAVDTVRSRLYIADNDNHRIVPYDLKTGSVLSAWGSPGQGRLQFRYPFLMDITDAGYLLVVEPINTRVQVLNAQGKFVEFVGAWGTKPGELFRPKGVTVNNGRVYVTDSYLGRVQVFELHGAFLGEITDRTGRPLALTTPMGLALDRDRRRLYVVELKANRVACLELE